MPDQIWEIAASGWFYYKEICYDARSRDRKKKDKNKLVIKNIVIKHRGNIALVQVHEPSRYS